jgi:predicted DsbA family dithiol-disulfide isomerase
VSTIELDIYSDVICPWCYIGKRKMERALTAYEALGGPEVSVRWRPFLLHPDHSGPSRPTVDYLAERFGPGASSMMDRVTEVAESVGLHYRMDRSLVADTRSAHQLSDAAFDEGGASLQGPLTERLLQAHFVEGLDVADHEVLTELGRDAGMADEAILRALTSTEARAGVEDELQHAYALGISAVPTFVVQQKYGVSGAQEPAVLLQLLQRAAGDLTDTEASASDDAACGPDGCEVPA